MIQLTLGGHLPYGPTGDGGFAVHAVLVTSEGDA